MCAVVLGGAMYHSAADSTCLHLHLPLPARQRASLDTRRSIPPVPHSAATWHLSSLSLFVVPLCDNNKQKKCMHRRIISKLTMPHKTYTTTMITTPYGKAIATGAGGKPLPALYKWVLT